MRTSTSGFEPLLAYESEIHRMNHPGGFPGALRTVLCRECSVSRILMLPDGNRIMTVPNVCSAGLDLVHIWRVVAGDNEVHFSGLRSASFERPETKKLWHRGMVLTK